MDTLDLNDDVVVIGYDSGRMLARHALAGDPWLRTMTLVDTEQSQDLHWRFRLLGDCFTNRSLLGGTFGEFVLAPLRDDPERRWPRASSSGPAILHI